MTRHAFIAFSCFGALFCLFLLVLGFKGVPVLAENETKTVPPSAASLIEQAYDEGGIDAARREFDRIAVLDTTEVIFNEQALYAFGSRLQASGKLWDGLAVFQMVTEKFPDSMSSWEYLGNAWVLLQKREQALAAYQRMAKLDEDGDMSTWCLGALDGNLANARGETGVVVQHEPGETIDVDTPWFGQELPGSEPKVFAPGIVSTRGALEFGITFTPDGRELYFRRSFVGLMASRWADGHWTAPAPSAEFPPGAFEAHITPDGQRCFFGLGPQIYLAERVGEGWSEPILHHGGMYATTTSDGTLYMTDISEPWNARLVRQNLVDGEYADPEQIAETMGGPPHGAHPCIAPDESFLIYDARPGNDSAEMSDLYVCFRRGDGTWTEPVEFGHDLNPEGNFICASLSPCGKYLFYTAHRDIWWVSTEILAQYRRR